MRRIIVLPVIIALMTNLEKTNATSLIPVAVPMRHVTKNAHLYGVKPKLRLKSTLAINPPNQEELVVDDDLVLGRNRNKIEIVTEKEEELSDYVKIRLMLARMKAMKAYSIASLSK
jgi:hypothetical protein